MPQHSAISSEVQESSELTWHSADVRSSVHIVIAKRTKRSAHETRASERVSATVGNGSPKPMATRSSQSDIITAMANLDCWLGKWALVTGASSGIGLALAEELGACGVHLVLTARRRQRLVELRKRLRAAYGIRVELITADLAERGSPERIFAFTERRSIIVDLLVNNAGVGSYGDFFTRDLERELEIVQLNCAAVVCLTHLYLPGMVERRSGDILIVASTAAYQAVPYMATYAASKAFDLLFAEGLAQEVKRYGVRVCALCPGPTNSEFVSVAGVPEQLPGNMESPNQVARVGLHALAAGEHSVISGLTNWLGVEVQRVASRRFVTATAEMLLRPTRHI